MGHIQDNDDYLVDKLEGVYIEFMPGNGTRYSLTLVNDPNGGILVIWPTQATYRYYAGDYLKFLHGNNNEFDRLAIWDYLEDYL